MTLDREALILARITDQHVSDVDEHGGVRGYCQECDWATPCPTNRWARGEHDPLHDPWDPDPDPATQDGFILAPQGEPPVNPATPAHAWYALDRLEDETGISGTGRVAYALPVPGAGVLTLWDTSFVDEDGIQRHSRGVEWLPDLAMLRAVHGHHGKTILTPLDGVDEAARARAEELLAAAVPRLETTLLVLLGQWREVAR